MVSALAQVQDPTDGRERLRLWLRLLRLSRSVENEVRERFRAQFDTTLPRFDVMAALARRPEGMMMGELSRWLLVSNGNVTGIVDRLVADGMVARAAQEKDRRASIVRLTDRGRKTFEVMATAHAGWIDELLGGFTPSEAGELAEVFAVQLEDGEERT